MRRRQLRGNTILITGGSSGIGLELAKVLIEKGNTVLICGRSEAKLKKTREEVPLVHTLNCDISIPAERDKLFTWVMNNHPQMNMLINNAALVHRMNIRKDVDFITKLEYEMQTNFVAPIVLIKLFIPYLENHHDSTIINITSGLAYIPKALQPVYSASKAALHSFTQSLRYQLSETSIQVIEVLMAAVDTPFHEGNPPRIAISPQQAVSELIRELENNKSEIRIEKAKLAYLLSRIAPNLGMKVLNRLQ